MSLSQRRRAFGPRHGGLLGELRDQGKTIFVVTHQAALMEAVADEFLRMAAGQLVRASP